MNTHAALGPVTRLLGRKARAFRNFLGLSALALAATGCATQEVNPDQPRAHTGYVDFHAEPAGELNWEVARLDDSGQNPEIVFSELKPPQAGVLRLGFAPGEYRFQLTFLNRVVVQPAEVAVAVEDGKITPVQVALIDAGVARVRSKEVRVGGTAYGRYGRRTKIETDTATKYRLTVQAAPPVPYQRREQMPYAR